MADLSLLALNVSAPTRDRGRGLLELLWPAEDDLWVLTETSGGEGTRLIDQVSRAAGHQVLATDPKEGGGRGVMVVGRSPGVELSREDLPPPTLLPGRVLSLRVALGEEVLRVAAVYGAASDPVRYSSAAQRQRKRDWLVAFADWLRAWAAADPDTPRLLVGDLNLVDPINDGGLRYVLPEETAAYEALTSGHGLVDAWRVAHPGSTEPSWVDHSGARCRYDHAFVDSGLAQRVAACDLDQAPGESGLTDHAALRLHFRG